MRTGHTHHHAYEHTHGRFARPEQDHILPGRPFLAKHIPAIAIHGRWDWRNVLHTDNDQAQAVNRQDVYLGYRLGVGLLARIDELPCGAFREPIRQLPADLARLN